MNKAELSSVVRTMGYYVALSFTTVGTMVALHFNTTTVIPDPVWVRASIVAVASLFSLFFALRALAGSPKMLLRLRIVTALMLAAIVVIVALPGMFPLWFKLEQIACALLLLPAVIRMNRRPAVPTQV